METPGGSPREPQREAAQLGSWKLLSDLGPKGQGWGIRHVLGVCGKETDRLCQWGLHFRGLVYSSAAQDLPPMRGRWGGQLVRTEGPLEGLGEAVAC